MPFLDSCQTQFFTVFHSDFPFSRAAITKTELKSKPQPRETKPHSRRGEMKRTKHRWSEALEWLQLISISFQALIWAESSILSLEQEPESKPPFPGVRPFLWFCIFHFTVAFQDCCAGVCAQDFTRPEGLEWLTRQCDQHSLSLRHLHWSLYPGNATLHLLLIDKHSQ